MTAWAADTVLAARGLVKRFGGITATDDVTLELKRGARHALIGPNGAGKTTLINLLTGVLEPSAGSISLLGQDISRMAPHQRVQRGLVRTFQINQLFNCALQRFFGIYSFNQTTLTKLDTTSLVEIKHQLTGFFCLACQHHRV